MPGLEAMMSRFKGVPAFCLLNLLQGVWQMSLAEEAQALPSGLYTSPRFPQGMSNATAFFQPILAERLQEIYPSKCMVWLYDLIIWDKTQGELVNNIELVLEWLEYRGICVTAHKYVFFESSIR